MNNKAKKIALIGVLSGLAFITMLIEIPFPLATWLKFDLSEVVVLYGMMVGGPIAGIAIGIGKTLLKFFISGSSSSGVGEIAALIATLSFILPSYFLYRYTKKLPFALITGTLTLAFVLTLANFYYITPFYAKLYQMNFIFDMINANDGRYFSYILKIYGLFNLTKGAVVSIVYIIIDRYVKKTYSF